jgi:hypothetical protein
MADKKISALTALTTPLAGTEVLPIVQSGATVKVAVTDLTAGRSVPMFAVDFNSQSTAIPSVGFIHYTNNILYGQAGTSGMRLRSNDSTQYVGINNSGISLTASSVEVTGANVVISTSGKGIDFSATSGTGTSELLADYEEGTFTPVISGDSGAGTGTYTSQTGYYTKIGRQVTVEIVLSWTAHTGVGNILVAGLPFTCNTASQSAAPMLAYNLSLTALNYLVGRVRANSTLIDVLQSPTGGGAWNPVPIDTNVDAFVVTATYFV